MRQVVDQLSGFDDLNTFVQNLPWPTFIAGTTCRGNKDRQRIILSMFTVIHEATKFDYYMDAIDFLKDFWAGSDIDWRSLIRAREVFGKRILVV